MKACCLELLRAVGQYDALNKFLQKEEAKEHSKTCDGRSFVAIGTHGTEHLAMTAVELPDGGLALFIRPTVNDNITISAFDVFDMTAAAASQAMIRMNEKDLERVGIRLAERITGHAVERPTQPPGKA